MTIEDVKNVILSNLAVSADVNLRDNQLAHWQAYTNAKNMVESVFERFFEQLDEPKECGICNAYNTHAAEGCPMWIAGICARSAPQIDDISVCSVCKAEYIAEHNIDLSEENYCPNCGAKIKQ